MSTTPNSPADWNSQIIAEFRANGGQVGGNFAGAPLLLLHSIGAKSGNERINPMMYQELGNGSVAVFASNAGADVHPAWYYNVVANPNVTAEIGETTRPFRARTAAGAERTPIWELQKASYPGFADYQVRTEREIPVVILDPA
jgi:deazaflavin-dependent oxidoreductase (nitroreductase family)